MIFFLEIEKAIINCLLLVLGTQVQNWYLISRIPDNYTLRYLRVIFSNLHFLSKKMLVISFRLIFFLITSLDKIWLNVCVVILRSIFYRKEHITSVKDHWFVGSYIIQHQYATFTWLFIFAYIPPSSKYKIFKKKIKVQHIYDSKWRRKWICFLSCSHVVWGEKMYAFIIVLIRVQSLRLRESFFFF